MTTHVRRCAVLLIAAGLTGGQSLAQPHTDGIATHRATYALFDGDKRVGESVFVLTHDGASDRYTFESQSRFRGLLRLAAPRPVVERSEFVITDSTIRPIAFTYEDGSRRGRRNIALTFDWHAGTMTVEQQDEINDVAIEPGTLDRGSVRVALMRDLARGNRTGTHVLVDPDVIRPYHYVVESTEEIETGLGSVRSHRVRQQRDGSSRHTLIWLAPSLAFVILRLEQHREDRDAITFVIESVELLDDGASRARD